MGLVKTGFWPTTLPFKRRGKEGPYLKRKKGADRTRRCAFHIEDSPKGGKRGNRLITWKKKRVDKISKERRRKSSVQENRKKNFLLGAGEKKNRDKRAEEKGSLKVPNKGGRLKRKGRKGGKELCPGGKS